MNVPLKFAVVELMVLQVHLTLAAENLLIVGIMALAFVDYWKAYDTLNLIVEYKCCFLLKEVVYSKKNCYNFTILFT